MPDPYEIAAWRFEQIAPLVDASLDETQRRLGLRERTREPVAWPHGGRHKPIRKSTLYRSPKVQRKHAYPGLLPKVRADREAPRRAGTAAWIGYPIGLLYEQPNRSLTQLAACLKLELTDYRLGHSILARRRYLTVRPHGFELHPGERLRPVLAVRILGFGSARTLHQNRKPLCRSLDAIRPTTAKREHRTCAEYALRTRCTSQVRLDLLVDTQPWRLLLAHTSEWPIPS